jgi:hypothetical protein
MQIDAAQHFIAAEGFAETADGERQTTGLLLGRTPRLRGEGLFEIDGRIDDLSIGMAKAKGLLRGHFKFSLPNFAQCF